MSGPAVYAGSLQVPGDPMAPITVDFGIHALRVTIVPRDSVLALGEPWTAPGVYVLLGPLGTPQPTAAYVGKASGKQGLRGRLNTHKNDPPIDWWLAVAIRRDTTDGFNAAEVGYLEGRLAKELDSADGLALKAGRVDEDRTLPAHVLLQLDAFVPTMLAALRVVGVRITATDAEDEDEQGPSDGGKVGPRFFGVKVADLVGSGELEAGTELTYARPGGVATAIVTADGQLIVNGKAYGSPSGAAKGAFDDVKAAPGWDVWRLDGGSGPTLGMLRTAYRQKRNL